MNLIETFICFEVQTGCRNYPLIRVLVPHDADDSPVFDLEQAGFYFATGNSWQMLHNNNAFKKQIINFLKGKQS